MIRVCVCDDEKHVCDFLSGRVKDCLAKRNLDGEITVFGDGEPLIRAYREGKAAFDILLLDISMKKCDGMTAARAVREYDKNALIVFVTASAEYVFSGYEVRAFRYILKPELTHGFDSVFSECLDELSSPGGGRFDFTARGENVSLPVSDILYFESDKRVIKVISRKGEYSFYSKLEDVENGLGGGDFIRCHQSYLVNAKEIKSLRTGELTLSDGRVIPVSRGRQNETREAFLWAMR